MKALSFRAPHLFSLIYPLLYWLATLALRSASWVNPKIREGLKLRSVRVDGKLPWLQGPRGQQPIWIHCASFEFEYAKPVITEIKRRDPNQKILVTYFSPTVRSAIEQFPGVDAVTPLPWDRVKDLREFLDYHRPRALLIARTDTWPIMLQQTRLQKIPSLLFAATLSENAGRLKPGVRDFTKWMFSNLDAVFCVNEADREQLLQLGPITNIQVAGDTRYDQVIARMNHPKPLKPFLETMKAQYPSQQATRAQSPESVTRNIETPRILVAGSTWEEDEKEILRCLTHLRSKQIDHLKVILVPHEPTASHIDALERDLAAQGFRFHRYSKLDAVPFARSGSPFVSMTAANSWPTECDVLIVDQIGILAELYAVGEFAFVGGSFRKTVHSVMEPLAAGCLTFLGPLHLNNREAIEMKTVATPLTGFNCVTPVNNGIEWGETLIAALRSPPLLCRSSIVEQVRLRSGRTSLVVDWVFTHRRDLK